MADTVKYSHSPHPRTSAVLRGEVKPMTTKEAAAKVHGTGVIGRLNARVGLKITLLVGTMYAAYIFAIIALLSLPQAITSHNLVIIVAWISSNFLQLILLPIIIVGQNIQATASDKRAEDTYKDAEAVLHEAIEIQNHLVSQDAVLAQLIERLSAITLPGTAAT